ncbi:MAG: hypothetical protein ACRDJT_10510 [Actinomycetota bacterium]
MRPETRRKLDLSYSQYVPRAFLFAWLVTGDDQLAARLALRGWCRSMGSMQDLRGPDVLEARMLRSVVWGAGRANLLHRPRAGDDIDGTWLHIPPRTRAALVMLYFDELDPRRVADLLECSDATLASVRGRGLNQLKRHLGDTEAEEEAHLQRWLAERAGAAPAPPPENMRLRHRVGRRRLGTVVGAALMAVLLAAGAVAGTRVALDRAANPPSERASDDVPVDPTLRNRIEALREGCPDPGRLRSLPVRGSPAEAARLAVRFNEAIVLRDRRTVRALAEPTAEPTNGAWVSTRSRRGVTVTSASKVDAEDLFTVACGRDIARRSLRVVIHDRNGITTKGLAFFYVAYTKDGWRVWAADEPGA